MQNFPKIDIKPQKDYQHCFGCGTANPFGLKLKFNWDGQTVSAEFVARDEFQGWPGYLHGGITSCALDEAMGWAAMHTGYHNVTAKMQIRFRQMAPIGQTYLIKCTVTKKSSRLIETTAEFLGQDGTLYADGTSTQYVVGPTPKEQQTNAK